MNGVTGSDLAAAMELLVDVIGDGDPAVELGHVYAWLAPKSGVNLEWDFYIDPDGEPLLFAINHSRTYWPHIFQTMMDALHAGEKYNDLYELAASLYNDLIFYDEPIWELYVIAYGIQIYGIGVNLCDEHSWWPERSGRWGRALSVLGITEALDYKARNHYARSAGLLIYSLEQLYGFSEEESKNTKFVKHLDDNDKLYMPLIAMLRYLFNSTGNDVSDLTSESIAEMYDWYPEWTPEDVAFVNELYEQAYAILDAAEAGQEMLNDETLRHVLTENYRRACEYERECDDYWKDDHSEFLRTIRWPESTGGLQPAGA